MVTTQDSDSKRLRGFFKYLVREEFRFHTELFGLSRFLGFPLLIVGLLSAGLFGAIELGMGSVTEVLLSFHALFFLLALQIGSVAFMADDAVSDLLGGRSTLLYTHAYLPVTQQTLVFLFVVKDLLFYLGLFVIPAAVSALLFLPLTIPQLGVLFVSLALVFTGGIGFSLVLASLGLTSRSKSSVLTGGLLVGGGVLFTQTSISFADLFVYTAQTTTGSLVAGIGTLVFIAVCSAYSIRNLEVSRKTTDQSVSYRRTLQKLLTNSPDKYAYDRRLSAIFTRTTSDVLRSGGGLFKIGFTIAILFGLTAYLLTALSQTTAIQPNYTLTITTILGLASYANYVWIFQNDSLEDYQYLPFDESFVKSAKRYAFHIINTSLLVGTAIVSTIVFKEPVVWLLGVFILIIPLSEFYFQFTFALAEFDPMDFLFDTARFTTFCTVLMGLFMPILIIGLFGPLFISTTQLIGFFIGYAVLFLLSTVILKKYT